MPRPVFCPDGSGTEAEITRRFSDEEGDWVEFQCTNGYVWQRPSLKMIIRVIGWGPAWREKGELLDES